VPLAEGLKRERLGSQLSASGIARQSRRWQDPDELVVENQRQLDRLAVGHISDNKKVGLEMTFDPSGASTWRGSLESSPKLVAVPAHSMASRPLTCRRRQHRPSLRPPPPPRAKTAAMVRAGASSWDHNLVASCLLRALDVERALRSRLKLRNFDHIEPALMRPAQ